MTVTINGTTGYTGPIGAIGDLSTTGNTTLGDASGDTLTINGSTTTFTQGTANGVAYLNGSKVLTTGSALVFDGSNLGVGTTSPSSYGKFAVIYTDYSFGAFGTTNGTAVTMNLGSNSVTQASYIGTVTNHPFIIQTNSTERARVDTSGNLLVGATGGSGSRVYVSGTGTSNIGILGINSTTTPGSTDFVWASQSFMPNQAAGSNFIHLIGKSGSTKNSGYIGYKWAGDASNSNLLTFGHFGNDNLMNLDASGNLLVGTTSLPAAGANTSWWVRATDNYICSSNANTTSSLVRYYFFNPNGVVGSITTTGSSTAYATSSDYRLKENVAPMTGALATIAQLKPCTFTWKADGADGQGFIAHELQEVVPDCVTGEKDAVDEAGNIKPQAVDASFLVATLTAAIQELKAEFDQYKLTHP